MLSKLEPLSSLTKIENIEFRSHSFTFLLFAASIGNLMRGIQFSMVVAVFLCVHGKKWFQNAFSTGGSALKRTLGQKVARGLLCSQFLSFSTELGVNSATYVHTVAGGLEDVVKVASTSVHQGGITDTELPLPNEFEKIADEVDKKVAYAESTANSTVVHETISEPTELEEFDNTNIVIDQLSAKYKSKFSCIQLALFPQCDFYLCGTLHVAKHSVDMVKDVIQTLKPNVVMLELCCSRLDSLMEDENLNFNITIKDVVHGAWQDRSIRTFGAGLLAWMQVKAANMLGAKLGGELNAAAREAYRQGSHIVLGDRAYEVTIQRIFDRLSFFEKLKIAVLFVWEMITMSLMKVKEYVQKSHDDEAFIADEIERVGKHLPAFADVVINERDEYLAQSLVEIAKVGFRRPAYSSSQTPIRGKIVAIVGAGHLAGIKKHLAAGGVIQERLKEISTSSKHEVTWPGEGLLHVVDAQSLYSQQKQKQ